MTVQRSRSSRRRVNGVLLLDKPSGMTSNTALQRVKRLFNAAKAGHTGTLDPLATGLLPICLGEATKFSQYLLDSDKVYQATAKLGQTTSTGDSEGDIIDSRVVNVARWRLEQAIQRFTGKITQLPPMYSALKHQGKALYHYARRGETVERPRRAITIHRLILDRFQDDEFDVTVACGKGTYIRVLMEDIGNDVGCGAHLIALRRLASGRFSIQQAVTLAQLEQLSSGQRDGCLLLVDALLEDYPGVALDKESAFYLRQGQKVWKARPADEGIVRLYDDRHLFIGLGEWGGDGNIIPRRLITEFSGAETEKAR